MSFIGFNAAGVTPLDPDGKTPPPQPAQGAGPSYPTGAPPQGAPAGPQPAPRPELWANIPQQMRQRRQWCMAAPDKRPLTITGENASTDNPATWGSFDEVAAKAKETNRFIGFMHVKGDGITVIDLDKKPNTSIERLARFDKILKTFSGTYAERSRSGNGYHIVLEGTLPDKGLHRDGVELYSDKRFMIYTGDVLEGRPVTLANHQPMLDVLVKEISKASDYQQADMAEVPSALTDNQVWEQLTKASNSAKCLELFHVKDGAFDTLTVRKDNGEPFNSASDVDFALIDMIGHFTKSNEQLYRIYDGSGVGKREKAKKRGRELLNRALRKLRAEQQAIESTAQFFKSHAGGCFNFTQATRPSDGFTLLTDDDLEGLPPLQWIVKDIIPNRGVGTIYGSTMTFKTFLTLDMLMHIAHGITWFGHRVRKTSAVYTPFEGKGGVPKRVKALRKKAKKLGLDGTGIKFLLEAKNLRDKNDRAKLIAVLKAEAPTGIVCIDTLAQAGPGIDENKSEGMGEMIAIFQEIAEATGWVVAAIHHAGKNASAGQRGWSGLEGALDFSIACYRKEAEEGKGGNEGKPERTYFETYKVKDAESGEEFDFGVEVVILGTDEDGDDITSLIVTDDSVPTLQREETPLERQAREAAQQAKATAELAAIAEQAKKLKRIDNAVWNYLASLNQNGTFPSKRYVEGRIKTDCPTLKLTQIDFRDAFDRLEVEQRVRNEGTHSAGKWRAIDNFADGNDL